MKKLPVLAILIFFCIQINAQPLAFQSLHAPAARPGMDILLHYTTPRDEVIIQEGKLTHISKKYHYDESRPYIATPAGASQQLVADGIPLNGHQLNALKEMISSSDFLYLPEDSYGAPDSRPGYEYNLRIKADGREKSVAYHSQPGRGNAPAPFERMQEYIWKLVTEVER